MGEKVSTKELVEAIHVLSAVESTRFDASSIDEETIERVGKFSGTMKNRKYEKISNEKERMRLMKKEEARKA